MTCGSCGHDNHERARFCDQCGTALARATVHFSGADVEGFIDLAKEFVLEEHITRGVERAISQADLLRAAKQLKPSTLDWLRTARNLVKYAGANDAYSDVEEYLRRHKII